MQLNGTAYVRPAIDLSPRWSYIRATVVRHFRCHADAFAQSRVRMNRFANIHRVSALLNRERNLADQVA